MKTLLPFVLGLFGSAAWAGSPAATAAPKLDQNGNIEPYFKKRHEAFLKRRRQGPPDLLFLGDSITEGWDGIGKKVWDKAYSGKKTANFGIGGDQTQHVLWRIENGELDRIDPKVVVLMIGTNNIPNYSAQDIIDADAKIVAEIHAKLPRTKVLLLGIFPRGENPADPQVAAFRAKIKSVNQGLAALDDAGMTRFLDIGGKFLDPNGRIPKSTMPDGLHPNAEGYRIWADAIDPTLREMLAPSRPN